MSKLPFFVILCSAWIAASNAEIIHVAGSITSSCGSICKENDYSCDDSVFTTTECSSMVQSYCGKSTMAYTKYQLACNQGTCYADCSQSTYYNQGTNTAYCDLVSDCYEVHQTYDYKQICPCISKVVENPSMFYGYSTWDTVGIFFGCFFFLIIVAAMFVYCYFELLSIRILMHTIAKGAASPDDASAYQRRAMSCLRYYDHAIAEIKVFFSVKLECSQCNRCFEPIATWWEGVKRRHAERAAARKAEQEKKSRFKKTKRDWLRSKKNYNQLEEENNNEFDEVSWYREEASPVEQSTSTQRAIIPLTAPPSASTKHLPYNAVVQSASSSDDYEDGSGPVISAMHTRREQVRNASPRTAPPSIERHSHVPERSQRIPQTSASPTAALPAPGNRHTRRDSPFAATSHAVPHESPKRIDLSRQESPLSSTESQNQFAAYEKRPARVAGRPGRITQQRENSRFRNQYGDNGALSETA